MVTFFELLGLVGEIFFWFLKEVDEEEIEKNINYLKRYEWFDNYLNNDTYKELINKNIEVRYVIGKCNVDKMNKKNYNRLVEKKIKKVLLNESHTLGK
ncbi:hypothetical protein [Domibacillus epiphyticus]|uniref:Uncharacterized protein n=1 Tax=Domibacillus epiphyticus TaxID=1714355 RepID=A0A1V2ACD3_9BACI|nr:hypothetical protein [Domibacillus epiphyticus]OMP68454.1 hypothetical protein BTO28_02200 [Domibacillus epiphyticus]